MDCDFSPGDAVVVRDRRDGAVAFRGTFIKAEMADIPQLGSEGGIVVVRKAFGFVAEETGATLSVPLICIEPDEGEDAVDFAARWVVEGFPGAR